MKRKVNPKNRSFNFKYVTPKDITNTIKNLNASKSPGYDNIPVIFIKYGIHQLSKPLASLIKKCIAQSVFPSSEKIAKVKQIYKSAEHNHMCNYRPISVLPVLSEGLSLLYIISFMITLMRTIYCQMSNLDSEKIEVLNTQ